MAALANISLFHANISVLTGASQVNITVVVLVAGWVALERHSDFGWHAQQHLSVHGVMSGEHFSSVGGMSGFEGSPCAHQHLSVQRGKSIENCCSCHNWCWMRAGWRWSATLNLSVHRGKSNENC